MYRLWNETDQLFASPLTYKTEKQAKSDADKFRKRIAIQGYYLTVEGKRITSEEVQLKVVPAKSFPNPNAAKKTQ